MATGGEEQVCYSLENLGTVTLQNTNEAAAYNSIVVCQDKIVVVDSMGKVKFHRLSDGKFLAMLDSESTIRDICLMDAKTICVLHGNGLIETASIESENRSPVFTKKKSFRLHNDSLYIDKFEVWRSVVRFKDNIVVVGVTEDTTYWCIASLDNGRVASIHPICKRTNWSYVTTKNNIIYISCYADVDVETGVYAFNISNPSECIKYNPERLRRPTAIVINENGNIFVGNGDYIHINRVFINDSSIYQLTASCQHVTIFTLQNLRGLHAMFWGNKQLYVTRWNSPDITVFRHVLQGNHTDLEVPISDKGKQPVIEVTSTQIGQEIADNGQSSVGTERPLSGPSPENPEDDIQGKHTDLEAPISDKGKQPVIEVTSTQIGQEIADNGQSSVGTERPLSGPSPENPEDDIQGKHTDLEAPISDKGKQPVIEVTSTQIGQEIADNGQSSVGTERPLSGPSPENPEDDIQGNHTHLEVPISDEGKQPVIEVTSTQIGQEIQIKQSVEEELKQAGIKMSTEERDLFIKFQYEIGTDIYFSKGPHRLIDSLETLKATETFIEQSHPDMKEKWHQYKNQGKLTPELIDVIYAEKRNKKLHENKGYFLNKMEQLNIVVKARAFNENGVKEENYFFTPCMLHKEFPREDIAPDKDARVVSTSVLCWVNTRMLNLSRIFRKLIAACLARWPVAKKKNTTESLIFQNCTVFDLDPVHRLFLHCENHVVHARIAIMGIDHINAKMCTRVRKFITLNLSEITSHQDPNIKYQLCIQNIESQDIPENTGSRYSPPFEMWFVDEVHDPAAPITREHMNHARLCVAIIAICGKAMRTILQANLSKPHKTIYQAILANKTNLIRRTPNRYVEWQKPLLNKDQLKIVFPDTKRQEVASIDQFDISLLYILIRNISTVKPPSKYWGVAPHDWPRDRSLGANVERIHLYRNEICGHSVDGQISQPKFDDYWKKIHSVLHDIDVIIGQTFIQELEMQRKQVISVYEAC